MIVTTPTKKGSEGVEQVLGWRWRRALQIPGWDDGVEQILGWGDGVGRRSWQILYSTGESFGRWVGWGREQS
ncbi:unnamed protein product [Linum trigynum]|uniref:Uncharacterized protein n=1 Tax=Linum trigynum TaxID=586398 RepID=A0AAV2CZI0_9ROSI